MNHTPPLKHSPLFVRDGGGSTARQFAAAPLATPAPVQTPPAEVAPVETTPVEVAPVDTRSDIEKAFDGVFGAVHILPIRGKNKPGKPWTGDGPDAGTVTHRLADVLVEMGRTGSNVFARGYQVVMNVKPGQKIGELQVREPKTGSSYQSKAVFEGGDAYTDQLIERFEREVIIPKYLVWRKENKSKSAVSYAPDAITLDLADFGIEAPAVPTA